MKSRLDAAWWVIFAGLVILLIESISERERDRRSRNDSMLQHTVRILIALQHEFNVADRHAEAMACGMAAGYIFGDAFPKDVMLVDVIEEARADVVVEEVRADVVVEEVRGDQAD